MGADDGRKVSGGIGTWRSDKRLVRQVIYFSNAAYILKSVIRNEINKMGNQRFS